MNSTNVRDHVLAKVELLMMVGPAAGKDAVLVFLAKSKQWEIKTRSKKFKTLKNY